MLSVLQANVSRRKECGQAIVVRRPEIESDIAVERLDGEFVEFLVD